MKHLLLVISIFTMFASKAMAQTDSTANWFTKPLANAKTIATQVGHKVAVCDTVVDYRVVNADLTLLNLGGKYPNQTLTIAVKGSKIKINPALIKGKAACFYGEVTMFKNKPEMIVTEPAQIKDIKQYQ
jgi:DNA/RNA endonuclease YhcR with UshA esterase domain